MGLQAFEAFKCSSQTMADAQRWWTPGENMIFLILQKKISSQDQYSLLLQCGILKELGTDIVLSDFQLG